jgi:hypothetical protein
MRNCLVIVYANGSGYEFLGKERPFRVIKNLARTIFSEVSQSAMIGG